MFERTKKLKPIGRARLIEIAEAAAPVANIMAHRPLYLPVAQQDLVEFLVHTQIDRYKWREAQPATDTAEVVCVSYSILLFGLLEQERLRAGCLWPLAACMLDALPLQGPGHMCCGFIESYEEEFALIEPQDDGVTPVGVFNQRMLTIQEEWYP